MCGPLISIKELKKVRHGIKQLNHSQEEKSVNVSPAALRLTDFYSCLWFDLYYSCLWFNLYSPQKQPGSMTYGSTESSVSPFQNLNTRLTFTPPSAMQ